MTIEKTMKQGEGKWATFTVTSGGAAYPLTGKTLAFKLKESETATTFALEKADGDFDKTDAANGIVKVNITPADSAALDPQTYVGEFQVILVADQEVDKSETIRLKIEKGII